MASSICQYTPVFSPGEPPDREAWQATVYRFTKSWTRPKRPCLPRRKIFFFACGISAPVSIEHDGVAAAWLVGIRAAQHVQGHGLPPLQEWWPAIRRPPWPVFLHSPTRQALRGLPSLGPFFVVWHIRHIEGGPLAGVPFCRSARQSLKGAPWVGSCSLGHCTRSLMGQTLLFSCQCWCVGREGMVMPPPASRDSTVLSCFPDCPAFLHRHSHHSLLPHILSIHLSKVSSSPHSGIAPQP